MTRGDEHMAEGHTPVRQCVGCRSKHPQATLVRVAVADGRPMADPRRRLPGRGAYVHGRTECLEHATRRGGLARALRVPVDRASAAELARAIEGLGAGTAAQTVLRPARGRSPEIMVDRPNDRLTRPEPRFVVGTPQSKDQQ